MKRREGEERSPYPPARVHHGCSLSASASASPVYPGHPGHPNRSQPPPVDQAQPIYPSRCVSSCRVDPPRALFIYLSFHSLENRRHCRRCRHRSRADIYRGFSAPPICLPSSACPTPVVGELSASKIYGAGMLVLVEGDPGLSNHARRQSLAGPERAGSKWSGVGVGRRRFLHGVSYFTISCDAPSFCLFPPLSIVYLRRSD